MTVRVLVTREQLQEGVARLGAELSAAYPDGFLAVGVLKGSVIFLADLVRAVTVPVEVDFLALSAYKPGAPRVRIVHDLSLAVTGRHVVVVEDVVDTGLTLTWLLGELARRDPASLAVCALLDKTARRLVPVPVMFRGFEVPDLFLLGYGLDEQGRYRNLDQVVGVDLATLRADPDAYVSALYRRRQGRRGDREAAPDLR